MDYSVILESLANKVPEMVVFLILGIAFHRNQAKTVSAFTGYLRSRDDQYEAVIGRNTDALEDNSRALGAALHVIEELAG